MVSKLSTSQFRYKVTKLILYDNYKHPKISKDFHFGKLLSFSKFTYSLFSITYKIFWITSLQSNHLTTYLFRIHIFTVQYIFILYPTDCFSCKPSIFCYRPKLLFPSGTLVFSRRFSDYTVSGSSASVLTVASVSTIFFWGQFS